MLDSPVALVALLLILGIASWALLGRGGRVDRRGTSTTAFMHRRRSMLAKPLTIILIVVALVFLVLAFTQFRVTREAGSAGTVVLALDVSESMSRTDVEPNRLEAAEAAARQFLEDLPLDLQVGLVTFAGEAAVHVPVTTERAQVVAALDDLPRGEGTVIGDGLTAALDALEAAFEPGTEVRGAVVLLSDGRDTGSEVPPDIAAGRAGDLEVPVHTVVLGQDDPAGEGGANVELLGRIAETTGGIASTAETAGGLLEVYDELRSQITTELAISDFGALFVGIAAVFAVGATVSLLFAMRSSY